MEEKYLCSYIYSHHLVIFFEITQMLNSYAQSDFKKKKKITVRCLSYQWQVKILKFFEATQELWNYIEDVNTLIV